VVQQASSMPSNHSFRPAELRWSALTPTLPGGQPMLNGPARLAMR
jgi:hypothetical protein